MNGEEFSKTFAYKIANSNYDSSDSKTLIRLSKAFDVSVDWLLDITNERSTNVELKMISNKIGLSVKSLENLIECKLWAEDSKNEYDLMNSFEVLDSILSGDSLELLADDLHDYYKNEMIKYEKFLFDPNEASTNSRIFGNRTFTHLKSVVVDGRSIDKYIMGQLELHLSMLRSNSPYGEKAIEVDKQHSLEKYDEYISEYQKVCEELGNIEMITNDKKTLGLLKSNKKGVKRKLDAVSNLKKEK